VARGAGSSANTAPQNKRELLRFISGVSPLHAASVFCSGAVDALLARAFSWAGVQIGKGRVSPSRGGISGMCCSFITSNMKRRANVAGRGGDAQKAKAAVYLRTAQPQKIGKENANALL